MKRMWVQFTDLHPLFRGIMNQLVPGIYKHYGGEVVFVAGIAINDEAEEIVVYMTAKEKVFWVRPLIEFLYSYELVCPTSEFMFEDFKKRTPNLGRAE